MLSTLKSSLKVSLVSLILIFSLTPVSRAHRHSSYSREDGKQADNPNWMSALPDSARLSELSIPGTHQSLSRHSGGVTPLYAVKNQSMALRFQLESGIRVLDVRCAIAGRIFQIYHGKYFQHENFGGVLNTVLAFLRAHPSETVLMRVKEERTDQPGTFFDIFRKTYWDDDKYKDHMWNPLTEMSQNPTLGSMRGKIVILQDFARWQCETPSSKAEFGLCYNSFDIQDQHQSQPLYNKWLAVKNYLDKANKDFDAGLNRDTKFMNYLSAVGASAETLGIPRPYFVVSGHLAPGRTDSNRRRTSLRVPTNQWPDFPRIRDHRGTEGIFYEGTNTLVYDFIRNGRYTKRVGIIMTDFPGGGLIERIICINYPKTDPRCKRLPK